MEKLKKTDSTLNYKLVTSELGLTRILYFHSFFRNSTNSEIQIFNNKSEPNGMNRSDSLKTNKYQKIYTNTCVLVKKSGNN